MAKITASILSPLECEQQSQGTDSFTAGWWFHGTTYKTAKAILSGQKKIHSPFWLTRNPSGASQHHGCTVLPCTVNLHKSQPPKTTDDKYNRKDGDEGLDQPYEWLGVVEGRVFIANDSIRESIADHSGSANVPTVGEELEKIIGKANKAPEGTARKLAAPQR